MRSLNNIFCYLDPSICIHPRRLFYSVRFSFFRLGLRSVLGILARFACQRFGFAPTVAAIGVKDAGCNRVATDNHDYVGVF